MTGYGCPANGAYRRGSRSAGDSRTRGFTLIELMIVLVIVAAILAFGLPTFSSVSLVTRLKAYANDMLTTVYLARGEAIKRNVPMTVCMSNDGVACKTTGDWDQGWIVADPNDVVLRYREAISSDYRMTGYIDPNDPGSTAFHTLTFDPSGVGVTMTTAGGQVVGIATINVCRVEPSVGHQERKVTIAATGRARITTTEEGSCPP